MSNNIEFEQLNHIGYVTLTRTAALNALTLPMINALHKQLLNWSLDSDVHMVVVQALPGKAFCAGGDVRWLYENKGAIETQMSFFWHEYRLNHLIHSFKKPYIALMDGMTMGGGVGISLHGNLPIGTSNFSFAMPETSIGFFPDIGASYLLSQCRGAVGMYLGLTGKRLNAEDCLSLGLIKAIISSEHMSQFLAELEEETLKKSSQESLLNIIKTYKLNETESPINAILHDINQAFHQNSVEEIIKNLEQGNTNWHHETLDTLRQKSPLSLKVTFEQIKRAKNKSFAECIKMDYCLVRHFMEEKDFYEGIRALLVDKDKNPNWKPAKLEHISEHQVAQFFECEIQLSFS